MPSDDSILLAGCLKEYRGRLALDIGVGSGIIAEVLCKNFEFVVGTDIVIDSLKDCKKNVVSYRPNNNKITNHDMRFELICADAASAFRGSTFDLVVSNPPYLPDDHNNKGKKIQDKAIYGGATGIEQTLHIVKSALSSLKREGSLVTIVSSLSDVYPLHQLAHQLNFSIKKIAGKKLFFETISAIEIRF